MSDFFRRVKEEYKVAISIDFGTSQLCYSFIPLSRGKHDPKTRVPIDSQLSDCQSRKTATSLLLKVEHSCINVFLLSFSFLCCCRRVDVIVVIVFNVVVCEI